MMAEDFAITFDPIIGWTAWAAIVVAFLALLGIAVWHRARGMLLRIGVTALLLLALVNPQILRESKEALDNIVLIVDDRSESQFLGERPQRRQSILSEIDSRLQEIGGLDIRRREVSNDGDGTRLFSAIRSGLRDIPKDRLAGVIAVTDGRIHDSASPDLADLPAPVHGIVTGLRDERDRRIVIESAPEFALVDRPVTLQVRVKDAPQSGLSPPPEIEVRQDGEPIANRAVSPDRLNAIPLRLERRGTSAIEVSVTVADNELTSRNNTRMLEINGVRDRLRVLLVSGEPHQGERVWRTALKSDPAVDLIHFTILRLPTSQDRTPASELSLIPFPTQRLFEDQLNNFDLVIFDRYRLRGVLQPQYFENLVNYVMGGGAILLVNGEEFAGLRSLNRTPLSTVLPAQPTGDMLHGGFTPQLTKTGELHPITRPFRGQSGNWGRWFRLVQTQAPGAHVLMSGPQESSVVAVSRMGQGRTAQILSDHLWLWARGIEGGGPHQALVRRLAHWLMKEPDLEEEQLTATSPGPNEIAVEYRSLESDPTAEIELVAPDGSSRTTTLQPAAPGLARATLSPQNDGIYRVRLGEKTVFVSVGTNDAVEMENPLATDDILAGLAEATGGGIYWHEDGMPRIHMVGLRDRAAGNGWLGLVNRQSSRTVAVAQSALLPPWLFLLVTAGLLIAAWRREST